MRDRTRMAKWMEQEFPVGAQVRAFVTGGVEWGSPLLNTWQQGEVVGQLIHRDLNDFGSVSDVTLTVRTPEGVTFEASFQATARAVTIRWADIGNPHRCTMELQGTWGNGPVAEGAVTMPWDNEHSIDIPLRRDERGKYEIDHRSVALSIVRDADNQIVDYVDPSAVHFAPDVPHREPAHAAR